MALAALAFAHVTFADFGDFINNPYFTYFRGVRPFRYIPRETNQVNNIVEGQEVQRPKVSPFNITS